MDELSDLIPDLKFDIRSLVPLYGFKTCANFIAIVESTSRYSCPNINLPVQLILNQQIVSYALATVGWDRE